jgi:hypothetical protein
VRQVERPVEVGVVEPVAALEVQAAVVEGEQVELVVLQLSFSQQVLEIFFLMIELLLPRPF